QADLGRIKVEHVSFPSGCVVRPCRVEARGSQKRKSPGRCRGSCGVAPRFALIAFRGAEMKNPALGRVLVFRLAYASTTCCPFIRQNAHRYCLVPPWGLPFFTIMPVLTSMTLELPHRWQFSRYAALGRSFFSFSALMRGVSSVAVPSMTVNLGLSVIWPS